MNAFVQYLDQFNVLSPNHAKIYDEYSGGGTQFQLNISTQIEDYLLSVFANHPRSIIMTGNAGDGKTRLCRAVYEHFSGQCLVNWPVTGKEELDYAKGKIRIIKDLSELQESDIKLVLCDLQHQWLEGHTAQVYYLIAANEGKLTRFLSQDAELEPLALEVKQQFLDHNESNEQFELINLQHVSSSLYARRILNEWNQEENWADCQACGKAESCIILHNHRKTAQAAIEQRLVEQYRLLDCRGTHLTMREILIHISYVLTGGLTCQDIHNAGYEAVEQQSKLAYYNNFYGIHMPGTASIERGATQQFVGLDPGQLSVSQIDDYLLNGDLSSEALIAEQHRLLFNEAIDLLFGYYRKQIEISRNREESTLSVDVADLMPAFRRKYFFEASDEQTGIREKLVPYIHFYRFLQVLSSIPEQSKIRQSLIRGLNRAFTQKLVDRDENQLLAVTELMLVHQSYSISQVTLEAEQKRTGVDHAASYLWLMIDRGRGPRLKLDLTVFEYLMRLAHGELNGALKLETDILIGTFRNNLIHYSEPNEYALSVLNQDANKGVYVQKMMSI